MVKNRKRDGEGLSLSLILANIQKATKRSERMKKRTPAETTTIQ
jgi:hypothetical protein